MKIIKSHYWSIKKLFQITKKYFEFVEKIYCVILEYVTGVIYY